MEPGNEQTLIDRARNGDSEAFEALYRGTVERVYALCLRMSGDTMRAEELTQDVFVRAWEKLDTFRGNSRFTTWLHRLAVNVVLQDRRTRGRRGARETTSDDLETNVPHLFVAGDGAGKSRGIVGAAVNGLMAAEGILRRAGGA